MAWVVAATSCGPVAPSTGSGDGSGDTAATTTAAITTDPGATSCSDGCSTTEVADDSTACSGPCEPTEPPRPVCWSFGDGVAYDVAFVDGDMALTGLVDDAAWVARVQRDGTVVFTDSRFGEGATDSAPGGWGTAIATTTGGRVVVLAGENYDTKLILGDDVPVPRTWVGAYEANGELAWEQTFGDGYELYPHSLDVGASDTVAVLTAEGDLGEQYELLISAVLTLDVDGNVVESWTIANEGIGMAVAVSTAATGPVRVVTSGIELIDYSPVGDELGRILLEGGVDEEGEALAIGPGGSTVVAGTTADAAGSLDAIVHVVDADGSVTWSASFGDAGSLQKGWGAAIGPSGEVVVVGTERPSSDAELTPWVSRFDATGGLSWSFVPASTGVVFGAAIDDDGTIATAGVGDDQAQLCMYPVGS